MTRQNPKSVIQPENVWKTYIMGEVEVHALRGVSNHNGNARFEACHCGKTCNPAEGQTNFERRMKK